MKKHKPFAGIPAWHSTASGHLITNDRGLPATERDIDMFFRAAEPELDRLVIEMCEHERARGNRLTKQELAHYKAALMRQSASGCVKNASKMRHVASTQEVAYQVV